jgi:hypothetical protein
MTMTAATDADVQLELWRSFSSLLKAYAAAASLNGMEHHIDDLDEEDLQIHAAGRKLYILYHVPSQRGHWSIVGENFDERGHFQLTHSGAVVLENAVLDMDHGAIELVARLTKPAGAAL